MNLENYILLCVLRLNFASGIVTIPSDSITWKNFQQEFEDLRNLSFVRSFVEVSNNMYRLEFFSDNLLRAYQLVRHDRSNHIDIFVWKYVA